ncbi:ABC transporter ATP-binding protein [Prochlorococcus sp. MIT 1223]|uniref:ABC transporter ATP-binding protein n=1 Tax=Prochlorococcus sp. MIT 1223 TaxID=3096217 RepID=UPI002A75A025|nr:ABC transporter ATP-binding protein [Prochlorococcus sp. MIT 1223]
MLELKGIHFHPATSEKPILKGINLRAYPGIPTVIKGNSGSGKTTLIEIISGHSTPNSGIIKWDEEPINSRQRKWMCGIVFQFPERHFLGLTISQELRLGQLRLGNEEQIKVLNRVGLNGINLRKSPEELSGGQQRRLAIAVQLLKKPRILLLDEPTAGLDWSVRSEIMELLMNLAKDQLLIVVTHEIELFKASSMYSYQLNQGKLI